MKDSSSLPIFKARGCWCDQLRAAGVGDAQCGFCLAADLASCRAALRTAEQIVKSLATMLGWENVPPQDTLERDINALKTRAATAGKERDEWESRANTAADEILAEFTRAEAAEGALAALRARLQAIEWVLSRAEDIVAYESGKVAAYAFTQAWTELPAELQAALSPTPAGSTAPGADE